MAHRIPIAAWLLAGCPVQWKELEREQACLQVGYSIASVTYQCTGDADRANDRARRLEEEFRCAAAEVEGGGRPPAIRPEEVDGLFACAVALHDTTCADARALGDDLQAWLDTPSCAGLFVPERTGDDDDDDTVPPATIGPVTGVVRGAGGVPLADVTVCAGSGECGVTDAAGSYSFDVPFAADGRVVLEYTATDRATSRHRRFHDAVTAAVADEITLATPAELDLALATSGRAYDPAGIHLLLDTPLDTGVVLSGLEFGGVAFVQLDESLVPAPPGPHRYTLVEATVVAESFIGPAGCRGYANQLEDYDVLFADTAPGFVTVVTGDCP